MRILFGHTSFRTAVTVALVVLGQASSHAATDSSDSAGDFEEVIVVVGTRTERALSDSAATIVVKSAEDIERELTRDIADLVRFEPGVTVSGTGDRFGLTGFNIRGIDGNRVLTLVDNVRVPEEFSFGPFLSARRDFVDVDAIDRAEIGRGPVSALYGSDALGGIVSVQTLQPFDLVNEADNVYGRFRTGYSSADESYLGTANLALGDDTMAVLLTLTRREGQETNTFGGLGGEGPKREQPDPQDLRTTNIDAKAAFRPAPGHEFRLSGFRYDTESDSDVLSDAANLVRGVLVQSQTAEDARERTGWAIDYQYSGDGWPIDDLQLKFYQQTSETEQLTLEDRLSPFSGPQRRTRRSLFEQEIQGLYGQLSKAFTTGAVSHYVTVGVDRYKTNNQSLRGGGTVDALGAPLFEFTPLPTRDFPLTDVEHNAVFLQDEISLMNDRLLLSPGLRFDTFDASTKADSIYISGNPGSQTPADYDDSEVTFKLGAVYKLSDAVSVFARYSEGFRAPPYDDVNVGFSNPIGGYKTIANPDMVSETSTGIEVGARWITEGVYINVAAFRNDYEDFIESLAISPQFAATSGIDPADGFLTFQSVNRARVEIMGVEATATVDLGAFASSLDGFQARLAVAYADGEDTDRDEPLNSVDPLNGVFGFGYDAPSNRWGVETIWTLYAGKDGDDIDGDQPRLATAGYGIVDLLAYFRVSERLAINAGIFNLTDKRYLRWTDTGGIGLDPNGSPVDAPGRFSQPGFNYALNVRVDL